MLSPGKHLCYWNDCLGLSWSPQSSLHQNRIKIRTAYSIRTQALCECVRESLFPQQAEHQNNFRAHCSRSFSCKIKNRQAGVGVGGENNRPREERKQVKEGTPGCAGGWKEGGKGGAPCASTSEQAAEAAEGRRQLKFINQNHNSESACSKVINVNFLKS